jgi:DNA-binding transcriptional MerR regulator
MIYSSKELAMAAHYPDPRIFLNEIARYALPMQPKRVIRGSNRYTLRDLTLALVMGELRSYGFSTAVAADLLKRLDLEVLSAVLDDFTAGVTDKLIICVPQRTDLDEEFSTVVTSWKDFVAFVDAGCANAIPLDLSDAVRAKLAGVF